jgi:hypothetical protein
MDDHRAQREGVAFLVGLVLGERVQGIGQRRQPRAGQQAGGGADAQSGNQSASSHLHSVLTRRYARLWLL